MATHGEALVNKGYRVIPIRPGAKVPGRFLADQWGDYPGWSRHCERDTQPAELDKWSKWPDCAVGLACGEIIGIDIDILDEPLADELEQLAREMLGNTPAKRIGRRPKRALFFHAETPFRGRKMHPLEIYGTGSQMVLHAIHPETGEPYYWPGKSLLEIEMRDLPVITEAQAMAWLRTAYERVPPELRPARLSPCDRSPSSEHRSSDPRGTYEAIKSALEFIPNDDVGGSEWVNMLNAIKAALGEQGRDLWLDWSKSSTKSGASGKSDTAERRWKSARPKDIGAGTIYYLAEQRGWTPSGDLTLNGATADAIAADCAGGVIANASATLAAKASPPPAKPTPPDRFPPDLLDVGGIIGSLVRLCVNTARSPQRVLALGASICTVGVLAGRKYRTKTNLRTNVYGIGIADSGGGKDHARVVIKEALFQAGLKDYLGGEKIASGSGLLASLERHPCRIYFLDEFGHMVSAIATDKAKNYEREIWTLFTQLYTSAGTTLLGAEYADQKLRPRIDISQPCVSVYGTTVPGPLWSALRGSSLSDGSLARFLIFLTDDDYPDRQVNARFSEIPEKLLDGLKAIAQGPGEPGNMAGLELPDIAPEPYEVPQTSEADELLALLSDRETEWLRSKRGSNETAIIARLWENTVKVALIRAISDNPTDPLITGDCIRWAERLVRHCIAILLRETKSNVADSLYEANQKAVIRAVVKAAEKGIEATGKYIGNNVRTVKGDERTKLLRDMVDLGMLAMHQVDTGGKIPATIYSLPNPPTVH